MTDELNISNTPLDENTPQDEEKEVLVIPDYEEEERSEEDYQKRAINSRIHLTEEELAPAEPIKMTFKQKVENYFYHYKIITLVVIGVILVLVLGTYYSRQSPRDYTVHIFSSEQQLEMQSLTVVIDKYLSQYAVDLDGDGEAVVLSEYFDLTANQYYAVYDENGEYVLKEDGDPLTEPISKANPENYIEYVAASTAIDNDVNNGKTFLFLLDENNYKAITEKFGENIFVEINGVRRIPLYKDEKFADYCEENEIITDLSLCLISKTEKIQGSEELLEKWEQAYEYVQTVLKDCPDLV